MKLFLRSMAVAVAVFSQSISPSPASAKGYKWTPQSSSNVEYRNGNPIIKSAHDDYYLLVMPTTDSFYGRPLIQIRFANISKNPFTVGTESFSMKFDGHNADTKVLSKEEMISIVNNKAGTAAFVAGLGSNSSRNYDKIDAAQASIIGAIQKSYLTTNTIHKQEMIDCVIAIDKPDVQKYPARATMTVKIDDIEEVFVFDLTER